MFAAVLIAAGHPRLDGYRPAVADRVLRELYREVSRATVNSRPLALLDYTRNLRQVSAALGRFNGTL